jgi:PE-PPE domain
VAKSAAKHRKPKNRLLATGGRKIGGRETRAPDRGRETRTHGAIKAGAVSMAGLLAGGLVLAPHFDMAASALRTLTEDVLLAAGTIIFIDGNKYPYGSQRMAGELSADSPGGTFGGYVIGQYQPPPGCTTTCTPLNAPAAPNGTTFVFVNTEAQYPGTLGLYNGFGAPTGDQSIALGQAAVVQDIGTANPSPTNPVTVVGYSEGAAAASNLVPNYGPSSNVNFVLMGNPENPNGGILARFPTGTTIPLLGITADGPTSSSGAPVVIVTQEYDGIADAPAYPLNLVADANAVLGFVYLHSDYQAVNPNASTNIVTTSGNLTEILVPTAPGALPLEMPLATVGVPNPILVALAPALQAIINTGYPPSSPDVAGAAGNPAQHVEFALLPPPSAWLGDVASVIVGIVTTAELLPGALLASLPVLPAVNSPAVQTKPVTPAVQTKLVSTAVQTKQVSDVRPTSLVQSSGDTNATNDPATNAGQTTPDPTTSSTNASATGPGLNQPVSTPTPKPTPKPTTLNLTSGNKVSPSVTGSVKSSNGSKPLEGALTSVGKDLGSLIGGSPKSTSTSGTSPQGSSGSKGKS